MLVRRPALEEGDANEEVCFLALMFARCQPRLYSRLGLALIVSDCFISSFFVPSIHAVLNCIVGGVGGGGAGAGSSVVSRGQEVFGRAGWCAFLPLLLLLAQKIHANRGRWKTEEGVGTGGRRFVCACVGLSCVDAVVQMPRSGRGSLTARPRSELCLSSLVQSWFSFSSFALCCSSALCHPLQL
jgi:hypothetical protein